MDLPDSLPQGLYAVYALIDPTDGLVYYVGQTQTPQQRFSSIGGSSIIGMEKKRPGFGAWTIKTSGL